ncbi:YtxH domain-containing protein [Pontibacter cellulosilyticus]|nr:YtxH domain-containing protein [Pontibacter cellulosilyticus]
MRTKMESRSLGEERSTYSTNASVRQIRQQNAANKKEKSKTSGAVALGLLAGAAAGAIAGVLLAPDKGTITRKKVADSATKFGDQVSKSYSATKDKVNSWTGKKEPYKNPNLSKNQPGTMGSTTTGTSTGNNSNWDDQEVNRMINDARKTPGL